MSSRFQSPRSFRREQSDEREKQYGQCRLQTTRTGSTLHVRKRHVWQAGSTRLGGMTGRVRMVQSLAASLATRLGLLSGLE
jgi:hypothetical protein